MPWQPLLLLNYMGNKLMKTRNEDLIEINFKETASKNGTNEKSDRRKDFSFFYSHLF